MNFFVWGAIALFSVALIEIFLNKLVDDLIPPATTKYVRLFYIGVIAVLALIAITAGILSGDPATSSSGNIFTHQIRIQTEDEAPIVGANVALDVPGSTSILATTDTSGVAVLRVPETFLGETTVLNVNAPDFEAHRQFVTIRQGQMPELIILDSK